MRPDQEEFFTVLYREYFNQINVGLTAGDSAGMISISYDVQSNKLASSIGVETVDIYKADGSYVTTSTGE